MDVPEHDGGDGGGYLVVGLLILFCLAAGFLAESLA